MSSWSRLWMWGLCLGCLGLMLGGAGDPCFPEGLLVVVDSVLARGTGARAVGWGPAPSLTPQSPGPRAHHSVGTALCSGCWGSCELGRTQVWGGCSPLWLGLRQWPGDSFGHSFSHSDSSSYTHCDSGLFRIRPGSLSSGASGMGLGCWAGSPSGALRLWLVLGVGRGVGAQLVEHPQRPGPAHIPPGVWVGQAPLGRSASAGRVVGSCSFSFGLMGFISWPQTPLGCPRPSSNARHGRSPWRETCSGLGVGCGLRSSCVLWVEQDGRRPRAPTLSEDIFAAATVGADSVHGHATVIIVVKAF
ncbi:uncharacterized protein LOC116275918 isoform X5 [Papio anubis]|uniref:uncharacterized protein LOC116275918 isoform X5 n=1 Tax=Papio anubis TaxID=9555 RepID=UPI0012AE4184|nr:uncharacterized protein LOC116275918 isoform X5 [Papio anubis]XP_031524873.1 uncharacterized protein LOC116275918 isoform X5 [Papio anubis]